MLYHNEYRSKPPTITKIVQKVVTLINQRVAVVNINPLCAETQPVHYICVWI